ncbi:germination protein YpeB [Ectobacillus ponti]|uniref:Germination protein YpeB n=1 Tax=Ectobacillus ponti TaxID=2961894 RepID=A0AA41X8D5_9BACI|nr:germination protein YpeB [Ectobacillus ponti]MCP8970784.1 germination protein YpeB [Ectobacillus ponti]
MIRSLLVGILSIVVISTAYWGYREHQEKNAVLIRAENNYQRAFHDLTYNLDLLQDKIGTTLAMNSRTSLSPALAEVWRLTSKAHSDVGQLPLTILPFNKTEDFLSKIGDFSYRTAIRDLDKEPLSDAEYQKLQQLYQHASEIQKEMRRVQHLVIKNNLRWMDVELALSTNKRPADNTIIDGFRTVERNVEAYAETDFGPTATSLEKPKQGFSRLKGDFITEEQAKEKALSFLGLRTGERITAEKSGKGANNRFYSLRIHHPQTKSDTYMDVAAKGGYPIFVINNREIGERKLSLSEAADKGAQFLKEHGFQHMELYDSSQYDSAAALTFVTNQDGVRVYPESIQMKIALDDGSMIGFSARDYLSSYQVRQIPKPAISVEEARKKINQNVQIQEERKAIIVNDLKKEVLCYEFMGTFKSNTYQIFINAATGMEEKVKKLQNVEPVYD